MAYSGRHLIRLLRSLDIKRVVMRYSGDEGRSAVQSVNFLSSRGSFLGYQDIIANRMPENEFYALGLEILSTCKPDWADDWGGRGEINWDLGKDVTIEHFDRRVDLVTHECSILERELRNVLDHSDLPVTEMQGVSSLGCRAIYYEDADPVFGQYFGSATGEEYAFSKKLLDGARQVFQAASGLALARIEEGKPSEGKLTWTFGSKIDASITTEVERFDRMPFVVSVKKIKDFAF